MRGPGKGTKDQVACSRDLVAKTEDFARCWDAHAFSIHPVRESMTRQETSSLLLSGAFPELVCDVVGQAIEAAVPSLVVTIAQANGVEEFLVEVHLRPVVLEFRKGDRDQRFARGLAGLSFPGKRIDHTFRRNNLLED